MQKIKSKLTVYFDNPFWVGIYQRIADEKMEVCKIIFGAQPKDYEVYNYFMQNWNMLCFSPAIQQDDIQDIKINPKRMKRAINKQIKTHGVSTKAQQAFNYQQAQKKDIRKTKSRERKEQDKKRAFDLRQRKRKQKHKGKA